MRKDQARRLKYREAMRIQSNFNNQSFKDVLKHTKLSEGLIKTFTSKLIK